MAKKQVNRNEFEQAWIDRPWAWKRTYEQTGGKVHASQPIKFTCRSCGKEVSETAHVCPFCEEKFY